VEIGQFNLRRALLGTAFIAAGFGVAYFLRRHAWRNDADLVVQFLLFVSSLTLIGVGSIIPFKRFSPLWVLGLIVGVVLSIIMSIEIMER
jgi:hypothetical protein